MSRPRLSRKLWILIALALLLAAAAAAFIWLAAGQLVSPARRPLQAYHHKWLANPAAHGMKLERFSALGGKVPCLVATPDPTGSLGERGRKLREQLTASSHELISNGATRGTLVLLHGRRGRKEDLLPVAERFCAAGFRCLMPDLPAHGESPLKTGTFGTSPMEAGLAAEVLREASKRFQFNSQPAGLWGMSMGGAFAVRAAAKGGATWKALVVSSFDSLGSVIDGQLRWSGVAGGLIREAVATVATWRGGLSLREAHPVEWARNVRVPTLVAHGKVDTLIPLSAGRRLFEALGSQQKEFVEVSAGDHHDVLVTPMPLYSTMAAWFITHLVESNPSDSDLAPKSN